MAVRGWTPLNQFTCKNVFKIKPTTQCNRVYKQDRTGPPGCLVLARWAGWSAGQVGRSLRQNLKEGRTGTEEGAFS